MPCNVELSSIELRVAGLVGVERQARVLRERRPAMYGETSDTRWQRDVEGAAGEIAAAKALGLYWSGCRDDDWRGPDVGRDVQVRTAQRASDRLIVRETDRDTDTFVLVTGLAPRFTVHGWITAADAKRDEWRRAPVGRPAAWFVPANELHDIGLLKEIYKYEY